MARVPGGRKAAAPVKNSLVVEEHEVAVPQCEPQLMARLPHQFGETAVGTVEAGSRPRFNPQREIQLLVSFRSHLNQSTLANV